MIRSMTAFAFHTISLPDGELTWEMRSVNHRFLDANVRLPEEFRLQEYELRDRLKQRLSRGKVEAVLRFTPSSQSSAKITINEPLTKSLLNACKKINTYINHPAQIASTNILQWPGVIEEKKQLSESIFEQLDLIFEKTLDDFIATREREGGRLSEFIYQRCDQIAEIVVKVRKRYPEVIQAIREKMLARIDDLMTDADPERIEQEIALVAQRLDVDEELDRLMAHLDEINAVLERDEPVGRRLDFLMQELNREANTLASKSADTETTRAAVELKVLIEQMREQVQNIE